MIQGDGTYNVRRIGANIAPRIGPYQRHEPRGIRNFRDARYNPAASGVQNNNPHGRTEFPFEELLSAGVVFDSSKPWFITFKQYIAIASDGTGPRHLVYIAPLPTPAAGIGNWIFMGYHVSAVGKFTFNYGNDSSTISNIDLQVDCGGGANWDVGDVIYGICSWEPTRGFMGQIYIADWQGNYRGYAEANDAGTAQSQLTAGAGALVALDEWNDETNTHSGSNFIHLGVGNCVGNDANEITDNAWWSNDVDTLLTPSGYTVCNWNLRNGKMTPTVTS